MSRNNSKRYEKNQSPLISVLIPCYNRKEWIPYTLQSIREQTYGKKNIEVCICNDGGESIKDILSQYQDLNIIYTEHESNKGLPAARNTALRSCHGEFISLLDSDDIYMPLALEFRLSMLEKYNVECVYTRALQNIFETKVDESGQKYYQLVHQQLYWNQEFNRDNLLAVNLCPCNCTLISRKAWEESNYWFDEELKSGEDFDFWIAISRKFDFKSLRLLDCEDSYRTEPQGQMTGNRNFSADLPRIFRRWRNTAINLPNVIEMQNGILKRSGINPEDYDL
jgi:glycosyltransferase involved in cell wall biosynthesis